MCCKESRNTRQERSFKDGPNISAFGHHREDITATLVAKGVK